MEEGLGLLQGFLDDFVGDPVVGDVEETSVLCRGLGQFRERFSSIQVSIDAADVDERDLVGLAFAWGRE